MAHANFAVGVPITITSDPAHPARPSTGVVSRTTVAVRYSWRHRNDASAADYDAALVAEQLLIAAVYGVSDRAGLPGLWVSTARRRLDSTAAYIVGDLEFTAIHYLGVA